MTAKIPVADPASLLKALLASSDDCIKILDLAGNLLYMTEGGLRVMEVSDFGAIQGCPWPDFWKDEGQVQAKAALESARAGQPAHFVGKADTMAGRSRWWDVTVTPIIGAEGKVEQLLSISRDITESRDAEDALRESQDRLQAALEAGDTGTWDFNPRSGELRWDDRCYQLFGLTPGKYVDFNVFLDGLHPLDRQATELACMEAMQFDGTQSYDIEYRTIGIEDAVERWCSAKGRAFFVNSEAVRFIGTIRDIGELKRAEQQRDLLTHELQHRLKNAMAMVSAIARQTFKGAESKDTAAAIFDERLVTLNRAHDILTSSSWSSASMRAVVEAALAPHQTVDGRIRIKGPDFDLSAKQSLSLALALHEMATNAAKYGALSNATGTVDVHWEVECGFDGRQSLRFRWSEADGPLVIKPERRGFGTRLIENTLSNDFGRDLRIEYAPAGFECTFDCPLSFLAGAA